MSPSYDAAAAVWSQCRRSLVVVTVVVLSVASISSGDLASDRNECGIPLMPLLSCLPFVQGRGGNKPNGDCCNAVGPQIQTNFRCVCILLKDGMSPYFNVTFNSTAAFELTSLCNVSADLSKCIGILKLPADSKEARMFQRYGNTTASPPFSVATKCAAGSWSCGKRRNLILVAGVTASIFVAFILVGVLLYKKHRMSTKTKALVIKEREKILSANSGGRYAKLFSGKEMKKATNSFSKDRLLGSGGFGDVYKGILEDGSIVAVKIGKADSIKSTEQLLNEVSILSQVNHRSLVKLLGCCVELDRPLLVYEFINNGTLHDHIHTNSYGFLSWPQRLKIAHQAAQGLAYLHSSAIQPIYHRDIKSSNILLDESGNAKVSDFGLSRLVEPDRSHVTTLVQGTMGYLDPEYYRTYQLTDRSDVYSFGVVLLELMTSKRVIDSDRGETDTNLVVYVQNRVDETDIKKILDQNLLLGATKGSLEAMVSLCSLALRCLEEKTQDRPSMEHIVEEIEFIITTEQTAVGMPSENV